MEEKFWYTKGNQRRKANKRNNWWNIEFVLNDIWNEVRVLVFSNSANKQTNKKIHLNFYLA